MKKRTYFKVLTTLSVLSLYMGNAQASMPPVPFFNKIVLSNQGDNKNSYKISWTAGNTSGGILSQGKSVNFSPSAQSNINIPHTTGQPLTWAKINFKFRPLMGPTLHRTSCQFAFTKMKGLTMVGGNGPLASSQCGLFKIKILSNNVYRISTPYSNNS